MSSYPDNEKHWVILSSEFVAALGLMGWKPEPKPQAAKTAKPKPRGRKK